MWLFARTAEDPPSHSKSSNINRPNESVMTDSLWAFCCIPVVCILESGSSHWLFAFTLIGELLPGWDRHEGRFGLAYLFVYLLIIGFPLLLFFLLRTNPSKAKTHKKGQFLSSPRELCQMCFPSFFFVLTLLDMRNCYLGLTPLTLPYLKMCLLNGLSKLLLILLNSEGTCTQSHALKETLLLAHHQKPLSDPHSPK
jgi:hypothetical protein